MDGAVPAPSRSPLPAGKALPPHRGRGEKRLGKAKATHLLLGPLRSGVPPERRGQAGGQAQRPEQPGGDPRHPFPPPRPVPGEQGRERRLCRRRRRWGRHAGREGSTERGREARRRHGGGTEGEREARRRHGGKEARRVGGTAGGGSGSSRSRSRASLSGRPRSPEPGPSRQPVSSARGCLRPRPPPLLPPPAAGQPGRRALVIPTVGKAGACGFALKAGFVFRGAARDPSASGHRWELRALRRGRAALSRWQPAGSSARADGSSERILIMKSGKAETYGIAKGFNSLIYKFFL